MHVPPAAPCFADSESETEILTHYSEVSTSESKLNLQGGAGGAV